MQTRLQAAMERGDSLEPMVAQARRYVEKYPRVVAGRVLLGNVLLMNNDTAGALEQFERALAIDPRQAELRLNAGTAALQLGDTAAAEQHYRQAVSLDTGNARYRLMLGGLYKETGRLDEARSSLLEAIRLDSASHKAYAMLGEVLALQGNTAMAADQFARAIKLAGGDARFQQAYLLDQARLLLRDNRPADALLALGRLPPQAQISMEASKLMAACWAMQGDPARAATHFEQITILDPTHADAIAEAARWMIKADRLQDAGTMLTRLRTLRSDHPALAELEAALSDR